MFQLTRWIYWYHSVVHFLKFLVNTGVASENIYSTNHLNAIVAERRLKCGRLRSRIYSVVLCRILSMATERWNADDCYAQPTATSIAHFSNTTGTEGSRSNTTDVNTNNSLFTYLLSYNKSNIKQKIDYHLSAVPAYKTKTVHSRLVLSYHKLTHKYGVLKYMTLYMCKFHMRIFLERTKVHIWETQNYQVST